MKESEDLSLPLEYQVRPEWFDKHNIDDDELNLYLVKKL